jgi:hypothetical protein
MPRATTNATALEIPLLAFDVVDFNCVFIVLDFNFKKIETYYCNI